MTQPPGTSPPSLPGDPGAPAAPPPPSTTAPKIAVGLTLAVVLAAAATVVVLRSSTGGDLERVVPADASLFIELSLRPGGDQRAALDQLLGRLDESERAELGGAVDQALDTLFSAGGLSWETDVRPWIGSHVGLAIATLGADVLVAGADPVIVVSARDEAAARDALGRALASGDDGAFVVADGVAFIAEQPDAIEALRRSAEQGSLADDPEYLAARAAHGDVLAFAWGNAAGLAAIGGQIVPGGQGPATVSFSVRAEPDALVLEGGADASEEATDGATQDGEQLTPGSPEILESTSAGLLAALSMFDIGTGLERLVVEPMLRQVPGIEDVLGVLDSIALDIERDLAPWLKGELSFIVGGFSAGPLPDLALAIEVTDEASLDRFLAKVRGGASRLGRALDVPLRARGSRDGFRIDAEGLGAWVRRAPGKLVVASSEAYAQQVLTGAADQLADDVVYQRAIGPATGDAVFQLFVRIDRIRDLALAFAGSEARAAYEQGPGAFVEIFESLLVRAGSDGRFRLALTATP